MVMTKWKEFFFNKRLFAAFNRPQPPTLLLSRGAHKRGGGGDAIIII